MCVQKRDGTWRLCIDYQQLNLKIIHDSHPLPRVQDTLESLGGDQWFSLLDQGKACHQGFVRGDTKQHLSHLGGCVNGFVYLWA